MISYQESGILVMTYNLWRYVEIMEVGIRRRRDIVRNEEDSIISCSLKKEQNSFLISIQNRVDSSRLTADYQFIEYFYWLR
jgi:hypothetical protein